MRCFISKQIEQATLQLEAKFGKNHGFTRYDLFPIVLTDVVLGENRCSSTQSKRINSTYTSLATEILQTFDPERGSLANWTIRLVRHHRELKAFLLERGVYLVSDWAILNDTTPEQLSRVFSGFHQLAVKEIQYASRLLESYHSVYRRTRLALPRKGIKGQCSLPTTEQLQQIAQGFHQKTNLILSTEDVMQRLQEIAELLRQYRLCVRCGHLPTESLDDPNLSFQTNEQQSNKWTETDELQQLKNKFLAIYHQQLFHCLDEALKQVLTDRLTYLKRKKSNKSQEFITALHLFHCQGKPMGEIADKIGLQAQYQVSRLLKLKEFRADVKQKMLKALLNCILEQATSLTESEILLNIDQQQLEVALDEEITKIIREAEIEAEVNNNKNSPLNSLFSTCG